MPGRPMATRRRHVQARRVRRFEMERPSVVAVINEGASWTTVNAHRLPGLVLTVAALAVLCYLFVSPQFFVYEAQISGNQRLSTEQVYRASGADMNSIFFVEPRAVRERLLAGLPGLDEVRVALRLPAQVEIRVAEKQARFVWEAGGEPWLVDASGVIIGSGDAPPEAVHIRALEEGVVPGEGQALDSAVLDTAEQLSALLGARTFEYTPGQGVGWRTEQGWTVHFGVGGDLAGKVAVMRAVTAELEQNGITPQFLDVSVAGRPYYR